jgi:hypothetical protein
MTDILSSKRVKIEEEEMRTDRKYRRREVEKELEMSIGSTSCATSDKTTEMKPIYQNGVSPFLVEYATLRGPSSLSTGPSSLFESPPMSIQDRDIPKEISRGSCIRSANSKTKNACIFFKNARLHDSHVSLLSASLLPITPGRFQPVLPPQRLKNAPAEPLIPTDEGKLSEYITFPSTPFSLTSPLFRHGPIRVYRRRKCLSLKEEAVDWTSFQAAMLGIKDDNDDNNRDEADCRLGEEELSDITSWFSELGLAVGRMVKETPNGRQINAYMEDTTMRKINGTCCDLQYGFSVFASAADTELRQMILLSFIWHPGPGRVFSKILGL